jgi:hypothetical protein
MGPRSFASRLLMPRVWATPWPRMVLMSVLVLRPGEMSGTAVSDTPAPPGSVLVVEPTGQDPGLTIAAVAAVHRDAPWLPLAILGTGDSSTSIKNLLPLVLGPVVPLEIVPLINGNDLATTIREAVRRRPAPQVEAVTWYCRRRLSQFGLCPASCRNSFG